MTILSSMPSAIITTDGSGRGGYGLMAESASGAESKGADGEPESISRSILACVWVFMEFGMRKNDLRYRRAS